MIELLKNTDPAKGTARFLVRGSIYMPIAQAAILRTRYNDYPERYSLTPGFPRAGRRGASRPPAAQGVQPPQSGAPGLAPLPGAPPSLPEPDIYPPPRDRGAEAPPINVNPSMPQPPAGAPYSGLCQYPEGDTFAIGANSGLAAGQTHTLTSPLILRPFVIVHVNWWSGAGNNADWEMRIWAAQNTDAPASITGTGVNIIQMANQTGKVDPNSHSLHAYPNKYFTNPPWALKVSAVNGTAGVVDHGAVFDIVYL